jgi:small basic protein
MSVPTITNEDLKKFFLNIAIFNLPVALLAVLVGMQEGMHLQTALTVAGVGFLTAFIDLGKKMFKE